MTEQLDVESFREKFGKWYNRFVPWLEQKEAYDTYQILKSRGQNNRIFPSSDKTFNAFKLTNPDNINAIIIGQTPYHTLDESGEPYADGLAFSNGNAKKLAPSLDLWYKALEIELDTKVTRRGNLDYLAEQGVLLLNSCFTTELNKATIHQDLKIWDGFNEYLYKHVLDSFCGIPVVCIGKHAESLSKMLFPMCHVIKCVEHPAYAAREHRDWKSDGMFNWINKVLKDNNGETRIVWDYAEYDDVPWK